MRWPETTAGGAGAVLAAAVLFGTTGTAQALADPTGSPYAVGAARLLVGGAGLVVVALLAGHRTGALLALVRTPAGLIAVAAVAGYQLGFFAGVARAGVAIGTLVGIGAAPVIAGLLSGLVDGRLPGRRWWRAVVVALVGLVLLSLAGASGRAEPIGLLLVLSAAACYAVSVLAQRRLIGAGADSTAVMAATFAGGAVLLTPVLVAGGVRWLSEPSGWLLVLYLGLLPTTLAYLLIGAGIRVLAPAAVVSLNLAEPVTAATLGVVLLGEQLTVLGALGALLVLVGVVLVGRVVTAGDAALVPPGKWGASTSASAVPRPD
jgi:drug/metabolite transporter, DME family